ncbi:sigma-54 dependent transcriptional regulator [Erythrobacter sp. SDW2]|uniref:sigma-54-dependent transcriptional regulator n=1 Tax=Erythrobacter sp. SDW2 TaxID=2907154 RepID=UPI001F326BC4|nr:sigma-54 dependent transcriptional regulator [Erythrobacter sp. SDW2]UIP07831.1 sigma-54 dependent transcriptional regulator [Erythrobacter sp. SDW2]
MQNGPVPDIVIIDDDMLHARHLGRIASAHHLACSHIGTSENALAHAPAARMALINSGNNPDVVRRITARHPGMTTIVLGDRDRADHVVDCLRAGASDVLPTDLSHPEALARLKQHFGECRPREGAADPKAGGDLGLAGESRAMERIRERIRLLSHGDTTTLIEGPTGVGKELVALALHRQSRRRTGPLIAVNCGAIPDDLIEGEFFGYEKGAFSGAVNSYPGKLALAHGGTLFLDEIGELSLSGQVKLLRAIEARQCYRLGGRQPHDFDIRIIAATNRKLEDEVAAGRFRSDLYYRIAVARIEVPPLAARPDDIVPLARFFLSEFSSAAGPVPGLREDASKLLRSHGWPGNARELRNAIEVALLGCMDSQLSAGDFALDRKVPCAGNVPSERAPAHALTASAIDRALQGCRGNKSEAARQLGCSRMTLYRHLHRG